MHRLLAVLLLPIASSALGCAMCASPYDSTYAAYGGLRERYDYCHGRVGSVITPASAAGQMRLVPQPPPQPLKVADAGPADTPDRAGPDSPTDSTPAPPSPGPSPPATPDGLPPAELPSDDLPILPEDF